ncbi:Tripeptidyl-peptidase 2 [Clarias magur]|uniref:Tripeptidyl-peptidase 2 n=1 Tax=Clarias magur TaxID=1594786 RepID=A0A8J4TGL2_CLAMG|nr:Tripeptidyl-peptidase 2 [Clarias magur]
MERCLEGHPEHLPTLNHTLKHELFHEGRQDTVQVRQLGSHGSNETEPERQ